MILGINDNGVRDLAHSLYHGGLVRITSHPRDKLIEKLEEKMSNKLFDRKCDVYRHNYDVQKCKMTLQKNVKC